MSDSFQEAKAFRKTWKSLGDSCRNFRCVTENFNDISKRRTYLECEAQDEDGSWKKNRIPLDPIVKFGTGAILYYTRPRSSPDTLSSNLLSPNPKVVLKDRGLELTAHGHGSKGPKYETTTLYDLKNENGVVFQSASGWSPRRIKLQEAREKQEERRARVKQAQRNPLSQHKMSPNFSAEGLMIEDKRVLVAVLKGDEGTRQIVTLNLDKHLGNNDGSLEWDGENFSKSAEDVEFAIEGDARVPILHAKLRNERGEYYWTDVNLAERIITSNGKLEVRPAN
ncbi:hypothetical protein PENFLA_c052G00584 [Penicillium flavigenum]|uniref:Cyanovirin-N domain-containing protein n=1 Tax=Penicillium flavigenum TaxID=254877 RepID=A0A1V6SGZ2_9EURO|nr:hypothetical protein PENFLA_c052G00584 [Penicillium flavigenum]